MASIKKASVFSDFASETQITDEDLKIPPTEGDLKDVQQVLDDFKIDVCVLDMKFNTRFALQRFLRDQITKKLKRKGE